MKENEWIYYTESINRISGFGNLEIVGGVFVISINE
jgi:hypothetical protein